MENFISRGAFSLNATVNAKEVGQELAKLGTFTPSEIVKRAKNKLSPLHKYFEWDDEKAAHSYRLTQARHLVLSISIETPEGSMRSFESVIIDDQRVYANISMIKNSPALVDQVLQSALSELLYWKAKHQMHKDFFGGVFDAIELTEGLLEKSNEEKGKKRPKRRANKDTANKKSARNDNNNRRLSATS